MKLKERETTLVVSETSKWVHENLLIYAHTVNVIHLYIESSDLSVLRARFTWTIQLELKAFLKFYTKYANLCNTLSLRVDK